MKRWFGLFFALNLIVGLGIQSCGSDSIQGDDGVLPAQCGNGSLEKDEACDDGNQINDDGCSNICQKNNIDDPQPNCGNGIVELGEACDDGDQIDNDECNNICKKPVINPAPVCGNAILEAGEECDDGNEIDDDGCSNSCQEDPINEPEPLSTNFILIRRMATDAQGNQISVGHLHGTVQVGNQLLASAGKFDVVVLKYNNAGVLQWAKNFGNAESQHGLDVAIDANQNIWIVGDYKGLIDFGNGVTTGFANQFGRVFVAKLDPNGTALLVRDFGNNDTMHLSEISVFGTDNVVVGGSYLGLFNINNQDFFSKGSNDAFLIRLNGQGIVQWFKSLGGERFDTLRRVQHAGNGDIVISGIFEKQITIGNQLHLAPSSNEPESFNRGVYVAKLQAANGAVSWSRSFVADPQFSSDLEATGLRVGSSVVVSGSSVGSLNFGNGLVESQGRSFFIAKLNLQTGQNIWTHLNQDQSGSPAKALALDNADNIYLVGQFETFDNEPTFFGFDNLVLDDLAKSEGCYIFKINPQGQLVDSRLIILDDLSRCKMYDVALTQDPSKVWLSFSHRDEVALVNGDAKVLELTSVGIDPVTFDLGIFGL